MVIVGPKRVTRFEAAAAAKEDEEEEYKTGCFNLRKIKAATEIFSIKKNKHRTMQNYEVQFTGILNTSPSAIAASVVVEFFSIRSILDATNHFKTKIGEGGFGSVHKGVLRNGKVIAVKRLSASSEQGREEFLSEVNILSPIEHPNIIKLLGYCIEQDEFILIYEYMQKDLPSVLFGSQMILDWATRTKICVGIAKGLAFLHGESKQKKIVHRDLKLRNVLLDEYLNPKICDFGLAKLFGEQEEKMEYITDRVAGTYGYMAPEYCLHGLITEKIDVYSFGVVILELISGKKIMTFNEDCEDLFSLACVLHRKGNLLAMIDADLCMDLSLNEASMMLDLAMLCTNPSPKVRPTMSEVVSSLEGKSILRTPPFHEDSALINVVPKKSMTMTMTVSTNYSSSNSTSVERNLIHQHIVPHLFADSDNVCDLDDSEVKVGSSSLESRMEGNDIQIAFEGDSVSEVIKDCISDAGKDDKLLIQEKVTKSPEPSTSSNPPKCVDATRMEDKRKLEYVETSFEEGKFHIECSDLEFEAEYNKWKDSVVGFFVDEEPLPFNLEKETVEKLWELKGEVSIFPMETGYFLFQFTCNEDKIMVLESSPCHINEKPLVLREWDWKLKFGNAEMITLPIWVMIYNLPLFLWSSYFLSKVGSCLGIPLYSDRKTVNKQSLLFARLCIEIGASKELPDSLHISVKGVDYKLRLEYDWKPSRCATCCTFGHTKAKCGLKMKNPERN